MSSSHPIRPAKKPKRKRYTGLIWPKDPPSKPFTPSTSPRLLDLFTSRGPDIFLGNTSRPRIPRGSWSNWSHLSGLPPKKTPSFLPWPFPRYQHARPPTQLYDFATRRYREWTPDWRLADYPCAYCSYVSSVDYKHEEGRARGVRVGKWQFERNGKLIDERMWERREHQCGCEDCRFELWKRWQKQQDRVNIADYRCDGLS